VAALQDACVWPNYSTKLLRKPEALRPISAQKDNVELHPYFNQCRVLCLKYKTLYSSTRGAVLMPEIQDIDPSTIAEGGALYFTSLLFLNILEYIHYLGYHG
jgi:hypothetical protein